MVTRKAKTGPLKKKQDAQNKKDAAPAKSTAFYRKTDKKNAAKGKASVVRMEKEAAERSKKGEPTTKQQRGEYLRMKEAVVWNKAKDSKQKKKDNAAKAKKVSARKKAGTAGVKAQAKRRAARKPK